jgi:hypothetical protein
MLSRVIFGALLITGAYAAPQPHGTYGMLTATIINADNQFSAGTLHIAPSVAAGTSLSIANLLAGDDFDAQLDASNTGTLSLLYSITSSVSGSADLASALQLTIRLKTSNACSARDGGVLYAASLRGAAIGDPSHGAQAGDRTLAAGNTESLCFTVLLPATATSALAGQSISATFNAIAEQS